MRAVITTCLILILMGAGPAAWPQEGPEGEPGDSTAADGAAASEDSDAWGEIMGPPVLGSEARGEVEGEGKGTEGGEGEAADSGSVPGAEPVEERAVDADVTPPGIPYSGEAGAWARARRETEEVIPFGPPAPGADAASALPPGAEIVGPPMVVSEDRSARYGYTLTLRSYREPRHKRFPAPEFRDEPKIIYDFDAVIDEIWLDHSSSRTFETEERSLSAFSEIDIPI
jgi:hypothetical protein